MAGYYTVMAGQTSAGITTGWDNFERAFAKKMNIRHALALCVVTASLIAALKAMAFRPGILNALP